MIAFNLFVFSIALPLMATLWLARWPRKPRLAWWSTFLFATTFVAQTFAISPWSWFGIEWRYVIGVLYLLALIRSLSAGGGAGATLSTTFTVVKFLLAIFFGVGAVMGFRGWIAPRDTIRLYTPLMRGAYIVGQGGSSVFVNYHNVSASQRYALDILKLNRFGTRARGLYPSELTKYAIFGDEIYAPCDGVVVEALDAVPDLAPPNRTEKVPAGNHVSIDCSGTTVVLAHMRRGSVRVRTRSLVHHADILGNVGNSGNTTEPHLHIHAERNGQGVGILIQDRWLVRNSVFGPPDRF